MSLLLCVATNLAIFHKKLAIFSLKHLVTLDTTNNELSFNPVFQHMSFKVHKVTKTFFLPQLLEELKFYQEIFYM